MILLKYLYLFYPQKVSIIMDSIESQDEPSRKKREPSSTEEEESYSAIEKLNDDCLIYIFNLLPVIDRIRIEKVNKRWQEIGKDSWSKLKVLNLNEKCLGIKPKVGKGRQYLILIKQSVTEILKRCGRYLNKIIFKFEFLDFDCMSLVAEHCINIQSITCDEFSLEGLKSLSVNCSKIIEFSMEGHILISNEIEMVLTKLFLNNQKLRCLRISYFKDMAECLLSLPLNEVEEIKVMFDDYENNKTNLSKTIRKTKKLRSFECNYPNEEIIRALALNCTNLTELSLICCPYDGINEIDHELSGVFKNNKKLKCLNLENVENLTGECLLYLDKNNIEKIRFHGTKYLNGYHLIDSLPSFKRLHSLEFNSNYSSYGDHIAECIGLCHKLKNLIIEYFEVYTEEDLMNSVLEMKNLETLKVTYMRGDIITNFFIDYIGFNLKELKYLDISGNRGVIIDSDLESICNLPKLEVLVIEDLEKITGYFLDNLPTLKKMMCCNCPRLKDYIH